MNYRKQNRTLRHAATFPFIWIVLFPMAIMDVVLEIYHRICFPLYGIPILRRKEYIRLDRHRLEYLSFFDKINCTYCAYANGLASYFVAIAGETEKYWCGIKHEPSKTYVEPAHHKNFAKYGDKKEYEAKYCKLAKKK
jgi:hypothetical protein